MIRQLTGRAPGQRPGASPQRRLIRKAGVTRGDAGGAAARPARWGGIPLDLPGRGGIPELSPGRDGFTRHWCRLGLAGRVA